MGRKPTKNFNLPSGMRARRQRSGRTFYYFDTGQKPRRELPLGSDFAVAVKRWAELQLDARPDPVNLTTFRHVAERYQREVLPKKAPRTQRDNLKEMTRLLEFFDRPPAPLSKIRPLHIRQYLDWRSAAPIRANREKALFSHIWNKAREWGLTDQPNPCLGIRGYREGGRDVYVEDDVYAAVYEQADQPTRDAMDLAYLTGQRPADTLKFRESDIKADVLSISQNKTEKKLRLRLRDDHGVKNELGKLVARIVERKRSDRVRSMALVCNESGQPLSLAALRFRFEKARARARAKAANAPELAHAITVFQFRDLRAKAGTDKADATGDIRAAQKQLGHGSVAMTEHYVRNHRGEKVEPTK